MELYQTGLRSQAALPVQAQKGVVLLYCPAARKLHQHELASHAALAKKLAGLKGLDFGGEYEPGYRYQQPVYFVPSDTLLCAESAALGIETAHQIFGGVVPFSFVATKTITHVLVRPASPAPYGWSQAFSEQVSRQVLPGYSAFTIDDIKCAASQLLLRGSIRMKLPEGIGGIGQSVIRSVAELETFLEQVDPSGLAQNGIVVETNLNEVVTYSVGQSMVGNLLISYCGTQRTTSNNSGKEVYGGSDLIVVRGDFEKLLTLNMDENMRAAIAKGMVYHNAALSCYPDMFVSRANYDVAQGLDDGGEWHCGVLEQSWRIGGASGAEILALEAFDADASLGVVRASTTELYGLGFATPDDAYVYYRGIDDKVGPLTKFAVIEDYAHLR